MSQESEGAKEDNSPDLDTKELIVATATVAIVAFVALLYFGIPSAKQVPDATDLNATTSAAAESSALVKRCVESALNVGYTDSSCATTYVEACVNTQSKTEMNKYYRTSKMLDAVSGICPNMQSAYKVEFDRIKSMRDRF